MTKPKMTLKIKEVTKKHNIIIINTDDDKYYTKADKSTKYDEYIIKDTYEPLVAIFELEKRTK